MTENKENAELNELEATDIEVVEADNAPEVAEKPSKGEILPDEGISELKQKLLEAQNARADAEKRARDMQANAHRAENEVQDTNLQLIHSAMDSVKRNGELLKQHYAAALQAGAFDKAAEIQEHISFNAAKMMQLENGRSALSARLEAAKNAPPVETDPVEQVASQLSPRSAAWIRNHPECVTDKRLYQKMVGSHNIAVADGYQPDTDEYFDFIEQSMGIRKPAGGSLDVDVSEPLSVASSTAQRRSAPPAAPTTRAASSTGSRQNVVRLSGEEREMAKIMGMTPEDYAKNKLALKREGKLN